MKNVLHILTSPSEAWVDTLMEIQRRSCDVQVIDLTQPDADYGELVRKIFKADSVEVW
jgi:hypothetical protein